MIDEILCTVALAKTRIALIDDGRVAELFIELAARPGIVGNIYLGRATRVLRGMEAAFIDLGEERTGFLGLGGTREQEGAEAPQGLRVCEGEDIMVQVLRAPQGGKAAGLSVNPALPGRYLVYTPKQAGIMLSRRLPDEAERARLTTVMEAVMEETGHAEDGFILRTAASGAGGKELTKDAAYLRRSWAEIEDRAAKAKAPALLFADLDRLKYGGGPRILPALCRSMNSQSTRRSTVSGFSGMPSAASRTAAVMVSRSATLVKTPRRMRSVVIRPKKRSTRLIQDAEVGVKWSWKRGCAASQSRTLACLWVP